MASKPREVTPEQARQNLQSKAAKARDKGVFLKVAPGKGQIKLSNAANYWKTNPETIYLLGYNLAGTYPELVNALRVWGHQDAEIPNIIAGGGISRQNFQQADVQAVYQREVAASKAVKGKTAEQKRAEDAVALAELDRLTQHYEAGTLVRPSKVKGTGAGKGGKRGPRARTLTLANLVQQATTQGKLVDVTNITKAGAVDPSGLIAKGDFPTKDISEVTKAGSRSQLRYVPGLNIAARNLEAYTRAANMLGAGQFAQSAARLFAPSVVQSPGFSQMAGMPAAAPFGVAPTAPAFAQPTQAFAPTQAFTPMTMARPTMAPTFPAPMVQPTMTQPMATMPTMPALPRPASPPRAVAPVLPMPSALTGAGVGAVAPPSPSRQTVAPVLPVARTSPIAPSQFVGGVPQPQALGTQPLGAQPLGGQSPRSLAAPVRLSPRSPVQPAQLSPRSLAAGQGMPALSSPGRTTIA